MGPSNMRGLAGAAGAEAGRPDDPPQEERAGQAETKYLGFFVGQGRIKPLADKVVAIQKYEILQTKSKCGHSWAWPAIIGSSFPILQGLQPTSQMQSKGREMEP